MPAYRQMGSVPRKRHVQFRDPDGRLYSEELFGMRGFSGPSSLLYHLHPPTRALDCRPAGSVRPIPLPEAPLRHRHLRTRRLRPEGDPVTGRVRLLTNEDVTLALCRPASGMTRFYKSAEGDELLFVHEGAGRLESLFGTLPFGPGDYLVIPRGTIYRMVLEPGATTLLVVESSSAVEPPRRYRNEYGQLLEHAPYCERDIRTPQEPLTYRETGEFEVWVRARGEITAYRFDTHPLDVVGWDGCVYPWALNIGDFEPITGRLHQPPPVHQTFEGRNFVVCSFVPRMLDYHPEAVPIPYFHSNVESDEVIYYCNERFGSRRGIEVGSITVHPAGVPHGPQPGAVEASLGKTHTEELAVMLDTFRPLRVTAEAEPLDDPDYPRSWL